MRYDRESEVRKLSASFRAPIYARIISAVAADIAVLENCISLQLLYLAGVQKP